MSAERRYSEKEIASIFERATRAQEIARNKTTAQNGLTLSELQTIGSETGITPDFIAKAAASLDSSSEGAVIKKTLFGLPDGVEHTIALPGPVSNDAWERLVVDLRETFAAHGSIRQDGALREWTNGNLKAIVEPTDSGWRLRLRTRKGEAKAVLYLGLLPLFLGLFMMVMSLTGNLSEIKPIGQIIATIIFIAVGLGFIGTPFVKLPGWAKTRKQQMEEISLRYLGRHETDITGQEQEEQVQKMQPSLVQLEPGKEQSENERPEMSKSRLKS